MQRLTLGLAIAVAVTGTAGPVQARYDHVDATRDCERAIVDAYGYREFYDVDYDETGSKDFRLSGKVRTRGADSSFSCRVRHKEVVSFKIDDKHGGKHHDKADAGTAAAIGAGVLGLAILGAAMSGDDDHGQKRSSYRDDPDRDALGDRDYIDEECRRTLVRHLEHDHGSVDRLTFDHAYLDDRQLHGQGEVIFEFGDERSIDFTCDYDRQGQIYDGDYRYY